VKRQNKKWPEIDSFNYNFILHINKRKRDEPRKPKRVMNLEHFHKNKSIKTQLFILSQVLCS
jgi:helix-turn-helix protein